jgi:hypothetical protein
MEQRAPHRGRFSHVSPVRVLVGSIVGALLAAATVVVAILSFDLNPVGPVVVAVASIGGGSLAVRRVDDPILKAAAIGLIVGGLAAVLLWPLFNVDSPALDQ